jgi:hypothetical protein
MVAMQDRVPRNLRNSPTETSSQDESSCCIFFVHIDQDDPLEEGHGKEGTEHPFDGPFIVGNIPTDFRGDRTRMESNESRPFVERTAHQAVADIDVTPGAGGLTFTFFFFDDDDDNIPLLRGRSVVVVVDVVTFADNTGDPILVSDDVIVISDRLVRHAYATCVLE